MTYWNLPSESFGRKRFGRTTSILANAGLNVASSREEEHPTNGQSSTKSDGEGEWNAEQAKEEGKMTVARIIATKGREVLTAQPHRTLKEITEILAARNVGAIIVADVQGNVMGILSERDIVRAIASRGAKALDDAVSMHMTTEVVTTSEDETVLSTVEKMTTGRFRHLPVMKEGRLAGIISIGDVVKFRLAEMEHEQSALREYITAI